MWIRKSKLKESMAERYDLGLQVGFDLACLYLDLGRDRLPPELVSLYKEELMMLTPIMQEAEQIARNHGH